jgi:hypothetical protein
VAIAQRIPGDMCLDFGQWMVEIETIGSSIGLILYACFSTAKPSLDRYAGVSRDLIRTSRHVMFISLSPTIYLLPTLPMARLIRNGMVAHGDPDGQPVAVLTRHIPTKFSCS